MTIQHQGAFDGMVATFHQLFTARAATPVDLVLVADLRTSIADRRVALALANGLALWMLDRNGNPTTTEPRKDNP